MKLDLFMNRKNINLEIKEETIVNLALQMMDEYMNDKNLRHKVDWYDYSYYVSCCADIFKNKKVKFDMQKIKEPLCEDNEDEIVEAVLKKILKEDTTILCSIQSDVYRGIARNIATSITDLINPRIINDVDQIYEDIKNILYEQKEIPLKIAKEIKIDYDINRLVDYLYERGVDVYWEIFEMIEDSHFNDIKKYIRTEEGLKKVDDIRRDYKENKDKYVISINWWDEFESGMLETYLALDIISDAKKEARNFNENFRECLKDTIVNRYLGGDIAFIEEYMKEKFDLRDLSNLLEDDEFTIYDLYREIIKIELNIGDFLEQTFERVSDELTVTTYEEQKEEMI